METIDNQLSIIERSTVVFENAGEILRSNKIRTDKAVEVGRNILKLIQENGITPELDTRAMNYLANSAKALKEMKEGRSEVTQIMDELKKMYTSLEAALDPKKEGTVPAQIQSARDQYVRECAEIEKKKREEAERIAAKAKEEVELRAHIKMWIGQKVVALITAKKSTATNTFNAITLDVYDQKASALQAMNIKIDGADLVERVGKLVSFPSYFLHDTAELETIRDNTYQTFNWSSMCDQWSEEMTLLKQDLVDKLPSKKAELVEEKRKADEAAAAAERARVAEQERQAAIANANAKQKAKLEEDARIAREQEAVRLEQVRKDQEAAAEEKRIREESEQARLRQEAEEANRKAELSVEMEKQADQTMIMFEQEAAMSESAPAPEARQGYDVVVSHQAGYVQIFQFWFEKEGKSLGLDKMEKTSLGQMKAFCEKYAHKNNEKIESKFITYNPSYKAVNRKAADK